MTVHGEFLVSSDIEESAGGIVWARCEGISIGEESHGVDVTFVTWEGLAANALSYVPQLGWGITGPGDEGTHVWGEGEGHDIAGVASELSEVLARFDVPEGTGHVPWAGHYLSVIEKATATQIASVSGQFSAHLHIPFFCL